MSTTATAATATAPTAPATAAPAPNPLHIEFYDPRWPVEGLAGTGATMDYFEQPGANPFYERDSVNQRVRQQTNMRADEDMLRFVCGCGCFYEWRYGH